MSYRWLKWSWAVTVALTAFFVGRDLLGPGNWKGC